MSDGKLQYEVEITGTDAAAAGLGKVETGLDKVASAEKRAKDSAYGARQAHEDWVSGYKGEVFSEMAEKIKRVAHVTRDTNPELKWMGEGFKTASSSATAAKGAIAGLSSGTIAARSASLAFSRLMGGDFVGAARAATMAVRTLHAASSAGMWGIYAAAAVAAIGTIITILERAKQKKRELEESKWAAERAGWEIEDEREERENPYSEGLKWKSDSEIGRELSIMEAAYQNAKSKTDHENSILAAATNKQSRTESEKILAENKALEDKYYSQMEAVRAEVDRRKAEKTDAEKSGIDRRQAKFDEQANDDRRQRDAYNRNVRGRRDLDRETELDQIVDPVKKADRKLAFLQYDKKVLKSTGGEDADAEILKIDREILSVQQQITQEKEAQAATEADARKRLEDRREEYRLSKLTTAEQLQEVEKKMAALRKGPKTTKTEGEMLDLQIRRDRLKEDLEREKTHRGSGVDEDGGRRVVDEDGGRRVVDGADYSLKEFNPGRSRFRGMGGLDHGRSAMWFASQTSSRFAAAGHVGVPSEMGRVPLDVKGIDQTNQYLKEICERL